MNVVFAAAIVLMYLLDMLLEGGHNLAALGIRLAWALELVLYALLLVKGPARYQPLLPPVNSLLTSLLFLALIWVTGAQDSPYLSVVPTLPLLLALIQPQSPMPALVSGITMVVGVLGMKLLADDFSAQSLAWAGMLAAATFFGVYGSDQFRKALLEANEARLERARREALQKLAVAERHRAQSEKLATVGRLAASVMHEVNNPLAFVRSNLDFLQREVLAQPLAEEPRQELEEVLHETQQGLERIRQIVLDLKGFSRMDAEEPSECRVADVVTDAARLAAVRLKHVARLRVEVPGELPEVFAIRGRLAQVLLNLLVNAGDALEEAKVEGAEVRVTGHTEGERVVLLVEDNGPGFPPEVLARLFEAFFTTKGPEKGTGLGLAISRELVERCGGSLSAANRPEGGARLRIELPVYVRPPDAPERHSGDFPAVG